MLASQFLICRVKHVIAATILSINSLWITNSINAQIIPDGTLNTQVKLIDGQQNITGGIQSGQNLFHSFQEFSPNLDFVTHFDNNSNIENIFTRVTGDSASFIDGLIKTNDNASLFILNPAGIIFGQNAQLDIGGSFITTTAESIIFANGTKFGTQLNQVSPLLTVNIPVGLQFGNDPGTISSNNTNNVNSELFSENNMSTGNTIGFLGGDIDLQNIVINALSGNVEIGSVAEGEIVKLSSNTNRWEFDYDNVSEFNDVKISQSIIDTSGDSTSGESGRIILQGKNLLLADSLLRNTDNGERGIMSLVGTNYIDLDDSGLFTSDIGDDDRVSVATQGDDIRIAAPNIKIHNGAIISASNLSDEIGSNITINADESLELSGFNEAVPSLILTVVGRVGGTGGIIEINTGHLIIKDGARIDSRTVGEGNAGNININARESILISGNSFSNNVEEILNSGLLAVAEVDEFESVSSEKLGESGSITINTPRLSLENGGEISVSNFGLKDAGDITINVGELLLNENSQIIAKTASGNGGSIEIISDEIIILRDQASIAATADFNEEGNDGDGGNIALTADNIVLFDESTINADANLGSGGKITITTQNLLTQKNPDDVITASSEVKGLDGTVEIDTPDINSKLETTEQRQSPLAAEESIYTGCSLGTDFSANKFSYIGRGGMRKGPFDSLESQEVIADLGLEDSIQSTAELNTNNHLNNNKREKTSQSITEATTWIINAQGKVELIAQAPNNASPSGCLFK